jgi:hypothetical protein
MNFALEELRQVDLFVIKIKKIPFPLFSCSLLFHWCGSNPNFLFQQSALQTSEFCFCSFKMPWNYVELIFSELNLVNIKTRFAFSQAYIFHV